MSADDVAVLVAAGAASLAAVGSLVTAVILGHRVRDLRRLVEDLRRETVPLVRQARVVEEAATEMARVGDVLGSAESVTATVDSASRFAYRAFANPVVKVLAFGTGAGAALRRLVGRSGPETAASGRHPAPRERPDAGAPAVVAPPTPRRHRRSRVRR
jgi:biopolymer transport protein ExbB/TolQ